MKISKIINFSHPLSEVAMEQLSNPEVENVPVQLDLDKPLEGQIHDIVNGVKTPLDGTVPNLGIVPPGMSEAALHIVVEIDGLSGSFPIIIPLRRNSDGIFVVAPEGAQSLQNVRDRAREAR